MGCIIAQADPKNPDYSELFSLMITPGPRHSPFLCPIFVVLFCKLKHKTGILRARNNSVSQWCGAAEDWSVFRCISRQRAVRQRALQPGSANESAAGRVPSQSEGRLVASRISGQQEWRRGGGLCAEARNPTLPIFSSCPVFFSPQRCSSCSALATGPDARWKATQRAAMIAA